MRKKDARASCPSFHLKADIAGAAREVEAIKERYNKAKAEISAKKKELAAAQRKFEKSTDHDERNEIQTHIDKFKTDLEVAESEVADLPAELEDARTELKDARLKRLSFWKATFGRDWVLIDEENRLGDFTDAIDHLYARYGRYFKVPTNKQVTDILEALDKDSRDWDKREPHAFYTTLKATAPDCTRSVKTVPSSPSQGCLVLLIAIVSVVAYYLIIR